MREVANGQLGVQVFPVDLFDALSISGTSAEVQFMPGIDPELARAHQAAFYARSAPSGSLSLVLGAGGQWLSVDEGRDEPYSAASDLKNSHRR